MLARRPAGILAALRRSQARADRWAARWLAVVRRDEERGVGDRATGDPEVDRALGGGLARGGVTTLAGGAGAGKTTLALRAVAAVQRGGAHAAFVDADGTLCARRALALGARPGATLVARGRSAGEALALATALVEAGVDVVVVDGLWALPGSQAARAAELASACASTDASVLLLEPAGSWALRYCFPSRHARKRMTLSGVGEGGRSLLRGRAVRLV